MNEIQARIHSHKAENKPKIYHHPNETAHVPETELELCANAGQCSVSVVFNLGDFRFIGSNTGVVAVNRI